MKEAIVFFGSIILAACLFFGAIGVVANTINSYSCASKWEESEYKHTKYGFVAGCRVSKDGVTYMPATSIRDF